MSVFSVIIIVLLSIIVVPILAYMVVKFGAAGYFRARRRDQSKENETKPKQ